MLKAECDFNPNTFPSSKENRKWNHYEPIQFVGDHQWAPHRESETWLEKQAGEQQRRPPKPAEALLLEVWGPGT